MVSRIDRYARARRRKVPMVKLFLPKLLRTKVKALLGRVIPESKSPVKLGSQKARDFEQELQDVDAALAKRATKEKVEEITAMLEADLALADLEAALIKLNKEEQEAEKVKKLEEEWKHERDEQLFKISPEELKAYEDALEEYGRRKAKAKVLAEDEDVKQLSEKLKETKG